MKEQVALGARRLAAPLFLWILGAAPASPPGLQDDPPELPEYVIKAGFLFNFAKYVEWPADAFDDGTSPIRIGVAGEDPFGDTLEKTFKGKTVNRHPFVIERFKEPGEIKRCHILFVARSEHVRVATILDQARKWSVLTVGEDKDFSRSGGVVNILIENGKPRLEVNPDAALAQKVTINAKLLKVATLVRTEK